MASIQAAVMTEPGRIQMREVQRRPIGGDELLLKIERTGICGSDKHMYAGHMGLPFPIIPGQNRVVHWNKSSSVHFASTGDKVIENFRIKRSKDHNDLLVKLQRT